MQLKDFLYVLCVTAGLLLIPVIGGWPWTSSDFVVMGALLFIAGSAITLVVRSAGKYKVAGIVAIILAFLWLWAELAVGLFTNWGS